LYFIVYLCFFSENEYLIIKIVKMSTIRFQALREASTRKPQHFEEAEKKSIIFGSNVFNAKAMKQYLTSEAYKAVQGAIQNGTKIDRKIADYVAMGMKEWALSKGVTLTPTGFNHLQVRLLRNTMLSLKLRMMEVIL
jgi:glutamine synthetase